LVVDGRRNCIAGCGKQEDERLIDDNICLISFSFIRFVRQQINEEVSQYSPLRDEENEAVNHEWPWKKDGKSKH